MFNRKVLGTEKDYWAFLYAETLFRLKQLEDLNRSCGLCFQDKIRYNHLIKSMIEDNHIQENPKSLNFTGKGNCGRSKF
ncbi:MAG TPA: hypothetical protein DHV28_10690 [Ignavibacteriales bacterium]|nr:hypothetical protein [Ignavibacteriales bacterium]